MVYPWIQTISLLFSTAGSFWNKNKIKMIILCNFVLIFSIHVFWLNAENEILNNSKSNFNNKNIDLDEYNYDYSENDENIKENINSKHFSAKTLWNTSIAESLDLLILFVKNISIYAKSKNIFKNMSENLNSMEIMIK